MPVRIVTDSSAGLPADVVEELGITVVDLHVMADGEGDGDDVPVAPPLDPLQPARATAASGRTSNGRIRRVRMAAYTPRLDGGHDDRGRVAAR